MVRFRLTNGNTLTLVFPRDGGAQLRVDASGAPVRRPADFRRHFPVTVGFVPVLGPLDHKEPILNPDTVRRSQMTHRASAHFRNYWHHFPDGFEEFAVLVARTWPGMEIQPPERVSMLSPQLAMYCVEDRIAREMYWAGFGFQVWCQLLTHISRAADDTLLVIDEPEIYLHPEVQRQLLVILREAGPDILIATHSTEIMAEADPTEILLIDKRRRSGDRLRDIEGVQRTMELVGSVQNITLTQLARSRRLVFVEGTHDFQIIRRFARRAGMVELAAGIGLTALESQGFSAWERIKSLGWGFESLLDAKMRIAAVFDRDFWSKEEVEDIRADLAKHLDFAHIHERKEIENYLLEPQVLQRAIERAVEERNARTSGWNTTAPDVAAILDAITTPMKGEMQAQYQARRGDYLKAENSPKDSATVNLETITWFEEQWQELSTRIRIVHGKKALRALRAALQREHGVTLTDIRIIDAYRRDEIPNDLAQLLDRLDDWRTAP